jgi:serine phosphatase RsbU (regulator of sigma subunit)
MSESCGFPRLAHLRFVWGVQAMLTSLGHGDYTIETVSIPAGGGFRKRPKKTDRHSGDFTGGIVCSGNRLRVALVDLSGHGTGAGPYHDLFQRCLREENHNTLAEWIAHLDAAWPEDRFATAVAADIDLASHQFACLRAGHPDVIFRDSNASARFLDAPLSGLVGTHEECQPAPTSEMAWFPFPPGAAVVLVSDGVLDAGVWHRNDPFGAVRLLDAVIRAGEDLLESITSQALQHLQGQPPEDDFTLIVIARRPSATTA